MNRKKLLRDRTKYDIHKGIAKVKNQFMSSARVTEAEIADALRHQAKLLESPDLLLALANALDKPDSFLRLKLIYTTVGTPRIDHTPLEIEITEFVEQRKKAGEKQEAAVKEAQNHFGLSRSTIMKRLGKGRDRKEIIDGLRELKEKYPHCTI
jgi:hypothetical protein